ncbi:hypothetical protein GE09DRAFT_262623 [Coniochaeta sp. 2T2.1]|nr:hypothetical protein GE09DRAFT_262623 [Coniochaeta sp. 2T2.1]
MCPAHSTASQVQDAAGSNAETVFPHKLACEGLPPNPARGIQGRQVDQGQCDAPAPKVRKAALNPGKGVKAAEFQGNRQWDSGYEQLIGTATRDIKLGTSFVVTDEHIDDILAFGAVVCSKLKTFACIYEDVGYGAKNDAVGLTDAKIASFAAACPNLTKVTLQGARNLGDASFIALLRSCPKLNTLEITGTSGGTAKSTSEALNTIEEHPEWAPKMKRLTLNNHEDSSAEGKQWHKDIRALSGTRAGLLVVLVSMHEQKKWGDWELEKSETLIRAGRKTDRKTPRKPWTVMPRPPPKGRRWGRGAPWLASLGKRSGPWRPY